MNKAIPLLLTLSLAITTPARSVTTRLVPDEYPTIQAAIDDSVDGDIVIVAPGTYTAPGGPEIDHSGITFAGKAITVRSQDGPETCIIDCRNLGRAFQFTSGENLTSILEGFTIKNGYLAEGRGAGIYCYQSSPVIVNCIVTDCINANDSSDDTGAGICCYRNSDALIINCTIVGNSGGGGIYCKESSPSILQCTIRKNSGSGINLKESSPIIVSSLIAENTAYNGGAIFAYRDSHPQVSNCTIADNSASFYGGGVYCYENSTAELTNSILWANTALYGNEIALPLAGRYRSSTTIRYCNIQASDGHLYVQKDCKLNWGPGNISRNPYFFSADDYHLRRYSPCIDAGDPSTASEPSDGDGDGLHRKVGNQVDIGAYEFQDESAARFCAVGWLGEFTQIDSESGQVPPTRTDLPSRLQALAWSPSGILYAGKRDELLTIDPATGDTNYLLESRGDIRAMAFSPTGQLYIAEESGGRHLRTINLQSGQRTEIGKLSGDATSTQGLAFSPDGILHGIGPVKASPESYQLFTIDVEDAETHLLGSYLETAGVNQSIAFRPDGSLYALGAGVFARLNPENGEIIGPVLPVSGEYRGLEFIPEPPILGHIQIEGPTEVVENSTARYRAVATYDDGTTVRLNTATAWSLDPPAGASIDENGRIRTSDFSEPCDITVHTRYTEGVVSLSAELSIHVRPSRKWHVPSDDCPTIQSAVDLAEDTDTIIVADGIYTGPGNRDIDFRGKAITLKSQNGPDNCIIDCESQGRGFCFTTNEGRASILQGFTITNGGVGEFDRGGGILCENSAPTIRNCIVTDNSANTGGGIAGGYAEISNCIISNNYADWCAGGIWGDHVKIVNCIITGNSARDHGAGIGCWQDSNVEIINCVMAGNSPHALSLTLGSAEITNSILWDNTETQLHCRDCTLVVRYSDVQGGSPGLHVIDSDPLFADPGNGDYHLLPGSPCIDAGTDAGVYSDFEGSPRPIDVPGVDNNGSRPDFDMGVYEAKVRIEAELMIWPRRINLRRFRALFIMAWVSLPEGITPEMVDESTPVVLYPGRINAAFQFVLGTGTQSALPTSILAFFPKAALRDAVDHSGRVDFYVIGRLTTGEFVSAGDTVTVITPHRPPWPWMD